MTADKLCLALSKRQIGEQADKELTLKAIRRRGLMCFSLTEALEAKMIQTY